MARDTPLGSSAPSGGSDGREAARTGLRFTLAFIEILDSMDVDMYGEFRFLFRLASDRRGTLSEVRFPERGAVSISEHPAMNRLSRLDVVLFEGEVESGEILVLEGAGEEVDRITPNDPLHTYRRVFQGDPRSWIGTYGPWDEGTTDADDPENLRQWRLGYRIERAAGAAAESVGHHAARANPAGPAARPRRSLTGRIGERVAAGGKHGPEPPMDPGAVGPGAAEPGA